MFGLELAAPVQVVASEAVIPAVLEVASLAEVESFVAFGLERLDSELIVPEPAAPVQVVAAEAVIPAVLEVASLAEAEHFVVLSGFEWVGSDLAAFVLVVGLLVKQLYCVVLEPRCFAGSADALVHQPDYPEM